MLARTLALQVRAGHEGYAATSQGRMLARTLALQELPLSPAKRVLGEGVGG